MSNSNFPGFLTTIAGNCACTTQQFKPIVFDTVAFQNSANQVYDNVSTIVSASINGTRTSNIGQPIFKSDYERMQFLLGKQNRASGAGVPAKAFALGTN